MLVNDNDELAYRAKLLMVRMCGVIVPRQFVEPLLDQIFSAITTFPVRGRDILVECATKQKTVVESPPEDSPSCPRFVALSSDCLMLLLTETHSLLLPPIILDPRREVGGTYRGAYKATTRPP